MLKQQSSPLCQHAMQFSNGNKRSKVSKIKKNKVMTKAKFNINQNCFFFRIQMTDRSHLQKYAPALNNKITFIC